MEELDLLKRDWKKNEGNYPKFSNEDIYRMMHKKSSSIVKWILIISILEFLFFLSLNLFLSDNKKSRYFMPEYMDIAMSVISYGIIFYFIFQFYNNYRKIKATDSIKMLMKTILHTRKTVSYYIIANITFLIVSMAIMFILLFNNDPDWLYTLHELEEKGKETMAYVIFFVGAVVGIAVFALLVWLFYKLIYGFLLKRLHRNYQELKKIDF